MVSVSSLWGRLDNNNLTSVTDYDVLALAPTSSSPMDFDQTRFSVNDEYILKASAELVDGLRKVRTILRMKFVTKSIFFYNSLTGLQILLILL